MPRKAIRKRRAPRRRRPGTKKVPRGLTPFPKSRMVNLRYITTIKLNAALNATSQHAFRSNSIYDPDFTGVGAQPYYTDQLFSSYNKCTVVGSKITVTPFGAPTTGEYSICGIYRDTDSTPRTANLVETMEKPGTVWKGIGDANQNPRTLSMTYSAKKNHRGSVLANTQLSCGAGSNPTDSDFFWVFTGCPNDATNPGDVAFLVKIQYTCVFHDRIEPTTS